MAYFNLGASENLSIEAFYQYEWAKTEVDSCGTLFAADFAASGCNYVTLPFDDADDASALAAGYVVERQADVEAQDGNQFGLSARYFAEALNDTEFGVYFMNIHSRVPMVSAVRNSMPGTAVGTATATPFVPSSNTTDIGNGVTAGQALSPLNPAYVIEFPED